MAKPMGVNPITQYVDTRPPVTGDPGNASEQQQQCPVIFKEVHLEEDRAGASVPVVFPQTAPFRNPSHHHRQENQRSSQISGREKHHSNRKKPWSGQFVGASAMFSRFRSRNLSSLVTHRRNLHKERTVASFSDQDHLKHEKKALLRKLKCPNSSPLDVVSQFVAKAALQGWSDEVMREAVARDLHEEECLSSLVAEWDYAHSDETLFLVLGLFYIARLSDAERSACAASDVPEQLHCMVDFARQELLSCTGRAAFLQGLASKQDEDVTEHLELLWAQFCKKRNIQVSSEEPERQTIYEYYPAEPYRKPSNGEFRWRCSPSRGDHEVLVDMTSTRRSSISSYGTMMVPKLFGLVPRILESSFFLTYPTDRLGWNKLAVLRERQEHGVNIKWGYSRLASHPGIPPFKERVDFPDGIPAGPFLGRELALLFQGMVNNKLLRALTLERPPLSVLPHYYAVLVCAQHARAWLGRYDLRIYYNHDLTYGRLGTQDATEEEEEEVWLNGFRKERTPSTIEYILRRDTVNNMWDLLKDHMLINMRPKDYDLAKPPNTPMWRAFKQYIGHPRLIYPYPVMTQPVLREIQSTYTEVLDLETKSKQSKDGLFPPAPEENVKLEEVKIESWM
ncbi:uncharacterized protein LOC9646138 [Selaginella moellendorffii]|uniref:uncharacterized protein LOC9646138 n=1 Tax=Selaginella moellendorffii TaxID=88036 RepID=UPI000D1D0C44|nr:uncharacterized protein LOC9646138 [Selaginella moellendorffii]|eukprot:XP_024522340.1 uncharacterized protein LOC9646138 [Selaginella moellendorffii]